MDDTDTPETHTSLDEYLRAQVAPRFQEQVLAAEQRLAAAQRELDDLRAATATIVWEVAGATPQVRRVGLGWVVELPMTEGRYTWVWQVTPTSTSAAAPDSTLTGVHVVKPLQRMSNAYPGR